MSDIPANKNENNGKKQNHEIIWRKATSCKCTICKLHMTLMVNDSIEKPVVNEFGNFHYSLD